MAIPKLNDKGRMADIPLSPEAKITVERRGEIVLIGVNRQVALLPTQARASVSWPEPSLTTWCRPIEERGRGNGAL